MTEKKMSFRQSLALTWRALGVWRRYVPGMIPVMLMGRLFSCAVPMVAVFFSARVLNALAAGEAAERVWTLAGTALAMTAVMELANVFFERRSEKQWKPLWDLAEKIYGDKRVQMDFVDADSQRVADMISQIKQNQNWQSWGLLRVLSCIPKASGALTSILLGLGLSVRLFTQKAPLGRGEALNHPLFMLLIPALMVLAAWGTGRLSVYCSVAEARLAGYARLGNRMFFNYGNFSRDHKRAMDIRLYRQQEITLDYIRNEGSPMIAFTPMIRFYQRAGGVAEVANVALRVIPVGGIYLFVCLKAWAGAFPIGSAAQYIGALTAVFSGIGEFMGVAAEIRANGKFLADMFAYLDQPNAMYQGSLTTEKRADRQYSVEFRDVSFRYPGAETWALRHVNIRFQVGSRLAVVGQNGSGKTTFIKLLCRLYDPTEGEILLNGINIRKYRYDEYMDIFSIVFQDFRLFDLPLGENVAGRADYDRARAELCLRQAGFGDRLDALPRGLDTFIGKTLDADGVEFSGGEAQKIAIARTLYKDAPFIVLDEPTAALDPLAEAEIYARFNEIVGDKTAIYISHR